MVMLGSECKRLKGQGTTMAPATRKMRRSRDISTVTSTSTTNNNSSNNSSSSNNNSNSNNNDEPLSAFEWYDVQGDAAAALAVFASTLVDDPSDAAANYNILLLSRIDPTSTSSIPPSSKTLAEELQGIDQEFAKDPGLLSPRKRKRNEWIRAYNRALVLQTAGDTSKCAAIGVEMLNEMIKEQKKPAEELAGVAWRTALLLLECVLTFSAGRHSGIYTSGLGIPNVASIVSWLELLDAEKDPQFKFLLALYKSRLDVSELDASGKRVESKIRSARKELKTAMEVFQHKLRPSFGADTGSVVSSANSEENASTSNGMHHEPQPQQPSSVVLQKHNQSALNLKANLEQLKGHTKKSLILCSEALGAAVEDPSYEAVHANNLGVVYETINKRHLALHSMSKGLKMDERTTLFHRDGTTKPDQSLLVLYNAAICSLQARNYLSAYECMATCVSRSIIFRDRPRCWLRMVEACVGVYSRLKVQGDSNKFSAVEING
jgi:CCR4-NOT transcription complex subunit 10